MKRHKKAAKMQERQSHNNQLYRLYDYRSFLLRLSSLAIILEFLTVIFFYALSKVLFLFQYKTMGNVIIMSTIKNRVYQQKL